MPPLETALRSLHAHPGVEEVLVVGHDGLLIQHLGDQAIDAETVSAMIPALAQAAAGLGAAAERGNGGTVVVRMERGVAVVEPLSADLLLAVLVAPDTGFAPLLQELHRRRGEIASLV
jgi:predicted regulator of Ras-like GTPase activity (Roadblock/LC7/MglB family)